LNSQTGPMSFRSIEEIYSYLQKIPKFKSEGKNAADFDLRRFFTFCRKIGNPQKNFTSVHVAGTNGKGSTCRLIASVYRKKGYKMGLYTSPHLLQFTERFVVDGKEIPDTDLLLFFNKYKLLINQYRLTYFEISTAIAFWWFSHKNIDLGIIETGLGGRLDATNILEPAVSVITNISLDHTDILGNTTEQIAREKGGIVKDNTPVVVGNMDKPSKKIIRNIAWEHNAEWYEADDLSPFCKKGKFYLRNDSKLIEVEPVFKAPVQAYNIAVAWHVTQILQEQFPLSQKNFIEGINNADCIYPNKGRFERLTDQFEWYFDGAHNPEAIRALKEMVETLKPLEQTVLVFSVMRDKVSTGLVKEFSGFGKKFYYSLESQRAASFSEINQYIPDLQPVPYDLEAQKKIFKEFESELVIFAGSFYFYDTVQQWIATFEMNC